MEDEQIGSGIHSAAAFSVGVAALWGLAFVIAKILIRETPVLWVLTERFLLAAIVLFAVKPRRVIPEVSGCIKTAAIIAAVNIAAYLVQTVGLSYTTAGKSSFLTSMYCIFSPFIAYILFKQRIGRAHFVGAAVSLAGVALLSLTFPFYINPGDLIALAGGFFFGLQIVAFEKAVKHCDSYCVLTLQNLFSGLITLPVAMMTAPLGTTDIKTAAGILYLGVVVSGISVLMQGHILKKISASKASLLFVLESPFCVLFARILLNEKMSVQMWLGVALVFFGIIIAEIRSKRPEKPMVPTAERNYYEQS